MLQAGVGAQRRDQGLLKAILGVVGADGCDEEAEYVATVLVEEPLERR